ncbi:CG13330 [Drosophila busckii]|uniref:CG13330 n=1 Tax=Drosophila busckii TaxID=30019 RepID=A0A0M4ECQ7_DROBS|nr:putative uncharacterized protein DDB_G0271982 [Drosophila busckii]ALC39447.1 CG13330 [Drosophila busckii]
MNRALYVPCSIYSRRQNADVFRNDPFKIQSYNFRYADKPVHLMSHYQRTQATPTLTPPPPKPPTFETYYYNNKFKQRTEPKPSSNFVEYRRRSLLPDFQSIASAAPTPIKVRAEPRKMPPLLSSCCQRDEYQSMRRGQSVTTMRQSSSQSVGQVRRGSASYSNLRQQPVARSSPSSSTFKLCGKRSNSSGCAININIGALDAHSEVDKSVRIEIDTKVSEDKMGARCSTESFVIDKRLSKFLVQSTTQRQQLERDERHEQLQLQQERRWRQHERERQRERERALDEQRLQALERERERDRLRLQQRETQRRREQERERERLNRQPMRAMSMPNPVLAPVVIMSSHLQRVTSNDRLPGMVPCFVHSSRRAERLQQSTRRLSTLKQPIAPQSPRQSAPPAAPPAAPIVLERRSSGCSSNINASVRASDSNASLRRLSATRLNERKLLNLQVNGVPVKANPSIHTRLNNLPIRITTSRPAGDDLRFSLNQVRNQQRSDSPLVTARRSPSRTSTIAPCSVNINVYADQPRPLRL